MAHYDRFDGLHFSSVTGNKLDLVFFKIEKNVSDQIPILSRKGKTFLSLSGSALSSD